MTMMRLARRNTSSMSCSMNSTRDVLRQAGDRGEQLGAFLARHAGGGLVEQQHLGLGGERQRDLQQPLLAVGELPGLARADRTEHQRFEDRIGLVHRGAIVGRRAPPGAGDLLALADRQRHRFERGEMREQAVDLEGAHKPAPHPLLGAERGDVLAAEQDLAAVGAQHPGHQVDQRGLAGAVRPDQRVAHAARQRDLDVLGDHERAEALVEAARGENRAHGFRPHGGGEVAQPNQRWPRSVLMSWAMPPRMPFGRNSTTAISSTPIGKYQYCGLTPENQSRAIM